MFLPGENAVPSSDSSGTGGAHSVAGLGGHAPQMLTEVAFQWHSPLSRTHRVYAWALVASVQQPALQQERDGDVSEEDQSQGHTEPRSQLSILPLQESGQNVQTSHPARAKERFPSLHSQDVSREQGARIHRAGASSYPEKDLFPVFGWKKVDTGHIRRGGEVCLPPTARSASLQSRQPPTPR